MLCKKLDIKDRFYECRRYSKKDFRFDVLEVIIEIKAVQKLQVAHELQLVNCLTIAKKDIGILVNFGGDKIEVKRKYRLYTPKK